MAEIKSDKFRIILEKHHRWLTDEPDGVRMDLTDADLSHLDFSNAT